MIYTFPFLSTQEASRIAAVAAAAASSGLPALSSLDILQQQAQFHSQPGQPAGESSLPTNGSSSSAAGLRPPQQQPVPVPTAAPGGEGGSPPKQAALQERLEAMSLSSAAAAATAEQEAAQQLAAAAAAAAAPLLPELPCTPQGGFGGGREQTPLMASDAKVFTVHVGNTYSQADYHVESLLEVRRLLRDFASISFRQTSRTGGR